MAHRSRRRSVCGGPAQLQASRDGLVGIFEMDEVEIGWDGVCFEVQTALEGGCPFVVEECLGRRCRLGD